MTYILIQIVYFQQAFKQKGDNMKLNSPGRIAYFSRNISISTDIFETT